MDYNENNNISSDKNKTSTPEQQQQRKFDQRGVDKMQLQLTSNDFYNYVAIDNDGFHYTLAMHKLARILLFAKSAENITESQMGVHSIWVDADSQGRYQILNQDHAAEEVKLVPAEFVRGKYSQAMHYFSICEDLKNKLRASKPGAEEQKLLELKSEIDSHLIRLVKLLIHDLTNIEHIAETIGKKLRLTIRNTADNEMFIPEAVKQSELMKNDEWLSLKFNNNNYYLDYKEIQDNNDTLYYLAANKKANHIIFARAPSSKFKTTTIRHLYISQDNGLGRYKIQTNEGIITTQFFVPVDYVANRYDRFRRFMDDFKKVHESLSSDAYFSQIIWYKLQEDAIYIMNHILGELESNLKQEIDKSLDHYVMSLASTIRNPNNFDDFYNKVVEREKRIRLQNRDNTYSNSLIIFNRRNRTTFIIHISNSENDIFYLDEKIRILISKYDPDYYVMVGEAWMPKNLEIQQRTMSNYRYGNISKLLSDEKIENLTFIAKTRNSINHEPDKSEIYEIIREKQYDESSRIIELRKFGNGRLDVVNQDLISSGV